MAAKQLGSKAAKYFNVREFVELFSLLICNFFISPLGERRDFLANINELRNLREGCKKNKNTDRATECAMTCVGEDFVKNDFAKIARHSEDNNILSPKNLLKRLQEDLSLIAQDDENVEISASSPAVLSLAASSEMNHSQFTTHYSLKRKSAFTLAEVLITLGIIGVVAALTIPLLIGKYSDMQRAVVLKKAYTNLNQAILMSQQEHGELKDWDRAPYHDKGMPEWSNEYIFKYMKKVTACEGGNKKLKCPTDADKICNLHDSRCADVNIRMAIYVLADGENIYIFSGGTPVGGKSDFLHIMVDTNGINPPNKFGKDVFVFTLALNDDKPLKTWGCSAPTRDIALRCCKSDSAKCTKLLEFDNWEFKKDYPW